MSASAPACDRPCWVQSVLILVCLAVMFLWALREPVTPDKDDCAARGRPADCWRDGYDESGRLVPR